MFTLADPWYVRLSRFLRGTPADSTPRHPMLAKMAELRCNPLLDDMKMYVSVQSIVDGIHAQDRWFDSSFAVRVARTTLHRGEDRR